MGVCSSKDESENNAGTSEPSSRPLQAIWEQQAHVIDQVKNINQLMTKKFRTDAHHLQNVFTAPLEFPDLSYKAPVFPKSPEEEAFIRTALGENFVFSDLSDAELKTITDAHEPNQASKGGTIIKEGDKGDYFYILQEGKVKYIKDGKEVGRAGKGSSFGELALLYSAPRAASVVALTDCRLFRLDQTTFRSILQTHNISQDSEKVDLLKNVPFLKDLDYQDLLKLAASMKSRTFKAGAYLARKGDAGDVMFLLQKGMCKGTDISVGNTKYEDVSMGPGEAFGERALLKHEPRVANIIAQTDVKTLTIDATLSTRSWEIMPSHFARKRQAQIGTFYNFQSMCHS